MSDAPGTHGPARHAAPAAASGSTPSSAPGSTPGPGPGAWADDVGPGTEGVASRAGTTVPRTGIAATASGHSAATAADRPRPAAADPSPATPATPARDERSLGELVGEVSRDLSQLVRQEIALARAELKESAQRAGKGAGMFGGAGVAGHMVLLFLSLALWWWLGSLLGYGWSALIVAGVWAVVAAVLAISGRNALRTVEGMPKTADSVKKIPQALRGHEERNS